MANIIHAKNPETKPKNSCFLSCFGVPNQKQKKSPEIIGSKNRKKSRWISWIRFRMKKTGTKTVPVDNSLIVGKSNIKEEIKVVDSDKGGGKRLIPANIDRKPAVIAVVSDQSATEKPRMAKNASSAQSTILESSEQLQPAVFVQNFTCEKQTIGNRAADQTKSVSHSQPITMSHSSSFPPPFRSKSFPVAGSQRVLRKKPSRKNDTLVRKFDPVLGMSILMVTLAIMLLWGKICAILCTSAWFYFIPYFKAVVKSSDDVMEKKSNSNIVTLDSEEYKKKVILEGLLEKNHRSRHRVW